MGVAVEIPYDVRRFKRRQDIQSFDSNNAVRLVKKMDGSSRATICSILGDF